MALGTKQKIKWAVFAVIVLPIGYWIIKPAFNSAYKDAGIFEGVFPPQTVALLEVLEDKSILQLVSNKYQKAFLRKVNPVEGDVLWRSELPEMDPIAHGYEFTERLDRQYVVSGNVFVLCYSYYIAQKVYQRLMAVDLETGKILYDRRDAYHRSEKGFFLVDEDRIYLESYPESKDYRGLGIMAFSLREGTLLWKKWLPWTPRKFFTQSSFSLSKMNLLFYWKSGLRRGEIYIIDKENGTHKTIPAEPGFHIVGKSLYYFQRGGRFNMYDLESGKNEFLWLRKSNSFQEHSLYKKKYIILHGESPAGMEARELKTGRKVWSVPFKNKRFSQNGKHFFRYNWAYVDLFQRLNQRRALILLGETNQKKNEQELYIVMDMETGKILTRGKPHKASLRVYFHCHNLAKDNYGYIFNHKRPRPELISVFDPQKQRFVSSISVDREFYTINRAKYHLDRIQNNILYLKNDYRDYGIFTRVKSSYAGVDLLKGEVKYGDAGVRVTSHLDEFRKIAGME